jgi:RNA polymerase sigma-70 factor, ECF subfamily
MRRYCDGDEQAFAQLVERHYGGLYHYVHRYFNGRGDAEDLVQDIFLKVVRAAHTYRVKARFTTWVYRIAHNACADHYRKVSKFVVVSMDENHGNEESLTLKDKLPDTSAPSSRGVLSGELQAILKDAIANLPEKQREIFVLREEMGLPFNEVARVAGCNVNTAKSRMRYALERLALYLRNRKVTEEVLDAYAL